MRLAPRPTGECRQREASSSRAETPVGLSSTPIACWGAVVVGAQEQRIKVGVLAGEEEHEVGACLTDILERMLLHLAENAVLLPDVCKQGYQSEPGPVGMARGGELLEIGAVPSTWA